MVKFMKEKLDSILKPKDYSLCKQPDSQTTNIAQKNIYYMYMPLQLP
ncbi:hypothetical protein NMY3_00496 [Candidatus Nitrosocosmicus oleophilus]|jgi:hypothetical protein|uniref:Uncharacterized protein n=1 Tax=Candidatus Nitrosocosmicus oleophilus TaxID=1353260 RepID=A0A654LTL2_9ARCH|nr:hypothetical protein NMY3_00496 [Candidatus Nitrosocosmicus oleophilus]